MPSRNHSPRRGQTRREFMRALMLAGAVPLLPTPRIHHRRRRLLTDATYDVLVVGAGAAGIAAARSLHDAGYTVAILEARNRIGGRAFTSYDLSPHPIELGAEYIHGEGVLTWDLLHQYGLNGDFPDDEGYEYTHLGNRLLTEEESGNLENIDLFDQLADFAYDWVDDEKDDISLDQLIVENADKLDGPLTDEMHRLINGEIASDDSADLDQLSTYGYVEPSFEGDGDTDFHVVEGYSTLLGHRMCLHRLISIAPQRSIL